MRGCSGGVCMVAPGGVRGCSGGGMHGCSGGVRGFFQWRGMHGFFWGVHGFSQWGGIHGFSWGGPAWSWGGMHRIRGDTVNERAVCILLECILVTSCKRSLEEGNIFTGGSLSTGRRGSP